MIKRFALLICLILGVFACSSYDNSVEDNMGEIEEANSSLGNCPRPTGGLGDPSYPFHGYITGVWPNPFYDYMLMLEFTDSLGVKTYSNINFGTGQAKISGPGWTGDRITDYLFHSTTAAYPNLKKLSFHGADGSYGWVNFDKNYSAYIFNGGNSAGTGITRIQGMGATKPQHLRFYFNRDNTSELTDFPFDGPKFDQCNYP